MSVHGFTLEGQWRNLLKRVSPKDIFKASLHISLLAFIQKAIGGYFAFKMQAVKLTAKVQHISTSVILNLYNSP